MNDLPEGRTVSVSVGGRRRYRMYLPFPDTDHLERIIVQTGEPYEPEMLRDMARRVGRDSLVIDAGANVGNHSIYLAAIAKVTVLAIEPNAVLADAITRTFELNSIPERLRLRGVAVGATEGRAGLAEAQPDNLGAQQFEATEHGTVPMTTLDALANDDDVIDLRPVAAIKIDVEGGELDVLRGAHHLLERDRPLVYAEAQDHDEYKALADELREHGYGYVDTFNWTPTHLFAFGAATDHEPPAQLIRERYAAMRRDAQRKETIAELTATIADVERQVEVERFRSAAVRDEVEVLRRLLADGVKDANQARIAAREAARP